MEITTTVNGTEALIAIDGKLTVQTSPDLSAAVDQLPGEICNIDMDLANLSYVSSSGLRVLVAASKLATKRNGTMRILHPCDEVMEVLDMTGLSQVFVIEH